VSIGKRSKKQVERIRQVVYNRDGGVCVGQGFGLACSGGLTVQHRVSRGMGGSAQYDTEPAWLITLCWAHNVAETSNASLREAYVARGWGVPRWVVDSWAITEVPVRYVDGWYVLVEGDRVPVTERESSERMRAIYG
jgi:hypothetical protein